MFHSIFKVGNEDITKAFIEKFIQKKIKYIDLDKDKILDKEYTEQKLGILDLKVTLDNGTICNIEVQLTDKYNTEQRMLDYWAKLYGSQLKEGDEYQELKPVISILIADYELKQLKDEEAYTKWQIIETKNRKKVLTENLELHIIILPRALKELKDKGLKSWLMFLNNPNEQEVSEMAKEDKELGKAMEQLEKVSGDYHTRRIAELREKAIRDEKSGLRGAREEGEQIGEKRGKKIEKEKIAKNMLEEGFDIETIERITKLSKEEIMKL